MARENKPAIVFIDEIDALCGTRGEGESEASRRIKTELLVQMDGVGHDSTGVLILGATNIPWQLDSAIRRRFQRRIHIGIPDDKARGDLFKIAIGDQAQMSKSEFADLIKVSAGFSGSDITNAMQEALMQPIRKIQAATHYKKVTVDGGDWKYTPCSPGDPDAEEMTWRDIEGDRLLEPPLRAKDFINAVKNTKPSVSKDDISKNDEWTKEFGSEA